LAGGWLLYVTLPAAFTDLYRFFAKESVVIKVLHKHKATLVARFQFKLTRLFTEDPNINVVERIKLTALQKHKGL
jgi:hypothetical protein